MDAPKCRTCGERHWGPICRTLKAVSVRDVVGRHGEDGETVKEQNTRSSSSIAKPVSTALTNTSVALKSGDCYNAERRRPYMREYMRKRRAKLKIDTGI